MSKFGGHSDDILLAIVCFLGFKLLINSIFEYIFKQKIMKIAHLIMAYKNPGQIERMIRAMYHPDFHFYIHLDLKIDLEQFEYLKKIPGVIFIQNRILCNWGGFSFVRAIISSLNEITSSKETYDFINLMSGQDYPIKPIEEINNFFSANPNKCFISYDQDPQEKWWKHAISRSELYHFTDLKFKGKYFVQSIFNKYLPKRSFPLSIPLYGSSDSSWWTITPDCAAYIVQFMKNNPKLERFMQYTWGSDEFLIATIIMNSPFKENVVNNNLRFITWSDGVANPRILTQNDLTEIKTSAKFFARKFDTTVDVRVMDELDQLITKKIEQNQNNIL